jgi:paraquat-inducible protein A
MKRVRCKYCNTRINLDNLKKGYEYHCPRCENTIYRPGESPLIITTLSLSALVVFFWAISLPLLSVYVIDDNRVSILESLEFLFKTDIFSGAVLSITIILIPISMIFTTLLIIYHKALRVPKRFLKFLIAFYEFIKHWNLIGVCFVGLLIAMIKLNELSDMSVLSGFWIFVLYLCLLLVLLNLFNPFDILHIEKRKKVDKNSLQKVALYLSLAIVFIIPSNLLPIMPTYKYSVEYANTIWDGIMAFYNDKDYFVAFVVFFTSLCIPFLKIFGLITMSLMVKYNILSDFKKIATRIYVISDGLGKYSMLDVFVVVIAASFIQYDNLVRIEIGEAIVPFSLVVFFTMMASKSFDIRLIWKREDEQRT